ncbi:MAG: amidohydrolase family protein [Ruminococcus sp.]|nr:amidohydrolase family protein [Ruminococcus sp.]
MKESLIIPSDCIPVIDAHCHIFPDAIAEKAMINVGRFYDLPMYTKGTLAELYAVRSGVPESDRRIVMQVIFSPATDPAQTKSINDFIAGICSKDKSILGFGTLHRDNADYKEEIRRIKALGLIGVKFHTDFQRFHLDDPAMLPIYREIAANHMPVIFHMGDRKLKYSAVSGLKAVLEEVPELTVIAAHMGGYLHWNEAYESLPVRRNLYFDISSTLAFISEEDLGRMLEKFGSTQFVFGSDFPMWNPNEELQRLEKMHLPEDVRRGSEYQNFLDFLDRHSE